MSRQESRTRSKVFTVYPLLLVLLGGVIILFGFGVLQGLSKEDQIHYQCIMAQSDEEKHRLASPYKAQQQRFNIHKHLFVNEGEERLQYRLHSTNSELIFNQQDGKSEVVERFQALTCLMQEQLIEMQGVAYQYVRYLEAEEAVYHYKTQELIADSVQLRRYLVPGHQLVTSVQTLKPLMTGTAKQVRLSLSHVDRTFKAQGFQATFQDIGNSL